MEYTVDKLAKLAGISARTLRYYDQIGLLSPARINSSGYRIYGRAEVDALQQILFYRELGMELSQIAKTMKGAGYDRMAALNDHLAALEARKAQTELLIGTLQKTIQKEMGAVSMTDAEKFEGLKAKLVEDNEAKYGKEIREKYGEDAVNQSNAKMMGLSQQQYDQWQQTAETLMAKLESAVKAGILPGSETGREIVQLHRAWLSYTWREYSPEAHRSLGEMYVADERFTAYYDKNVKGCAVLLRDAIALWVGKA